MNPFLPAEIFKAYDIRGIVGTTLSADIVRAIGHGLGSLAVERGQRAIAVGRDGRLSGPELSAALMAGIRLAGIDTIDVGCVPTPVVYFAAHELGCGSCVAVTGSHNPPDYNGLKMVIGGETLAGEAIQGIRQRFIAGDLVNGAGKAGSADVRAAYLARITSDVHLARPMKIVIDCGNGVAGGIAPQLFRALGCELVELFCEVDGHFPNHHPDPSKPENLQDVIRHAARAPTPNSGSPSMAMATVSEWSRKRRRNHLSGSSADALCRRRPAAAAPARQIIYDVKCTRRLAPWIRRTWRRTADVENRPRAGQGQTAGKPAHRWRAK
jgi:phosphomannomutase/phosphoglucomutase